MKAKVIEAFLMVRQDYSADRVLADPKLNEEFLRQCRSFGLSDEPQTLNRVLINARKTSDLKGLAKSKRTSFINEEDYRFAAEVAIRFLEQKHGVTLDTIVCDPKLAEQFDKLAAEVTPGFSALQYRWAALNLRKSKRLRPELLSQLVIPDAIQLGLLDDLDLTTVPSQQGAYIFYGPTDTLYVGESANLRKRIGKHWEHSDIKEVARWFWEHGTTQVRLELRVLPAATTQRVRRALETELIRSRHPLFNIKR